MGTAPASTRETTREISTPAPPAAPASVPTPAAPDLASPSAVESAQDALSAPGAQRARRGAWEHYRVALTSTDFLFAVLTALLTLASWLLSLAGGPPAVVAGLGIAGALAGGIPIAVGALRGLLAREMNVDELVTIAIGASIVVGEYWGAALVAFMMLFGKVLEDVTAARAEQALEGLGQLVPATARVLDATMPGGERTVPVEALRPGDVVLVRPGERVPVDGQVVSGRAAVEEAAITGESLPAEKGPGAEVFAGTLATGGALQVATTRTGEGTALGRIASLVKEAEAERAPIVRTADRWARWFTPAVLALAGVVWLATGEAVPAVTVLVVACPCALVLATPTAIVAGVARGARSGILIKGGARLEAAGRVDAVCLDKTGTLTEGRPVLRRVIPFDGLSEHTLLAYAAGAERLSEHPLSRAVLAGAAARGIAIPPAGAQDDAFVAVAGQGVAAHVPVPGGATLERGALADSGRTVEVLVGRPEWLEERGVPWPQSGAAALELLAAGGETALAVAVSGRAAGLLGVADAVRPEAAEAVRALRAAGLRKIVLLTGDRDAPAQAVAREVGIAPEDVHAGLLPEEKVAIVKRLRAEGHRVAMVGDGVNDAPALAAADVAVAMGVAGTDLALQAADVALMTDDLRQAADAIVLSRKTVGVIRQNLVLAAVWNAVAVAVAALGLIGPVAGALVHNVGSVLVVLNAARLVDARLRR